MLLFSHNCLFWYSFICVSGHKKQGKWDTEFHLHLVSEGTGCCSSHFAFLQWKSSWKIILIFGIPYCSTYYLTVHFRWWSSRPLFIYLFVFCYHCTPQMFCKNTGKGNSGSGQSFATDLRINSAGIRQFLRLSWWALTANEKQRTRISKILISVAL